MRLCRQGDASVLGPDGDFIAEQAATVLVSLAELVSQWFFHRRQPVGRPDPFCLLIQGLEDRQERVLADAGQASLLQSASTMTTGQPLSAGAGVWRFTVCVLAVQVPVETVYSWRLGLTEPYYLVKLVGWLLLVWGASSVRGVQRDAGVAFLAAGWGWLAANYWRAVADRVTRLAAGDTLRLGSVEVWFAGGCLVASLVGLAWSLSLTSRHFLKA